MAGQQEVVSLTAGSSPNADPLRLVSMPDLGMPHAQLLSDLSREVLFDLEILGFHLFAIPPVMKMYDGE